MRVVVVNLPDIDGLNIIKDLYNGAWCRGGRIGGVVMPPLSLLYAYASVKPFVRQIKLIDAVFKGLSVDAVISRIKHYRSDFIIAHTSSYTLESDRLMLHIIRRALPEISIFLYGNLTGEQANQIVDVGAADFVCCQDPEEVLGELFEKLSGTMSFSDKIVGLHSKYNREHELRPLNDLDEKPIPDRKPILKYNYPNPLARTKKWTNMLTARGCLFHCPFCNTPGYYQQKYRRHSLDRVIKEILYLKGLGYKEIFFRDDLFHSGRIKEFCEALIEQKIKILWSCNLRADTIDEDTVGLMAKSGCHTLKFGVESGDPLTLTSLNKPSREQTIRIFNACKKNGIHTHGHFMIGLPGETYQQMKKTMEFVHELSPYTFSLGLFTPHPGSTFYDDLEQQGQLTKGVWKEAISNNPSEVDDETLKNMLRNAYMRFYLNPVRLVSYAVSGKNWKALYNAGMQFVRQFGRIRS